MMTIEVVEELVKLYNAYHKTNHTLEQFNEFMLGQTVSIIGNQSLYYLDDVCRFLNGRPVID